MWLKYSSCLLNCVCVCVCVHTHTRTHTYYIHACNLFYSNSYNVMCFVLTNRSQYWPLLVTRLDEQEMECTIYKFMYMSRLQSNSSISFHLWLIFNCCHCSILMFWNKLVKQFCCNFDPSTMNISKLWQCEFLISFACWMYPTSKLKL